MILWNIYYYFQKRTDDVSPRNEFANVYHFTLFHAVYFPNLKNIYIYIWKKIFERSNLITENMKLVALNTGIIFQINKIRFLQGSLLWVFTQIQACEAWIQ